MAFDPFDGDGGAPIYKRVAVTRAVTSPTIGAHVTRQYACTAYAPMRHTITPPCIHSRATRVCSIFFFFNAALSSILYGRRGDVDYLRRLLTILQPCNRSSNIMLCLWLLYAHRCIVWFRLFFTYVHIYYVKIFSVAIKRKKKQIISSVFVVSAHTLVRSLVSLRRKSVDRSSSSSSPPPPPLSSSPSKTYQTERFTIVKI